MIRWFRSKLRDFPAEPICKNLHSGFIFQEGKIMKSREVGNKAALKAGRVVLVHEHRCRIDGIATRHSASEAEVKQLRISEIDGSGNIWIAPDEVERFVE